MPSSRSRSLGGNDRPIPSGPLLALLVLVVPTFGACVTRSAYDTLETEHSALVAERDRLLGEVNRLTIERDSYEEQYIEAQESYEDERVARETLATNLTRVRAEADSLDEDLGAERIAHLQAAQADAQTPPGPANCSSR